MSEERQDETQSVDEKKNSSLLIGGFALVIVLVIIALFLPPISLGERLRGGEVIDATAVVPATDDAQTVIPGEAEVSVVGSGSASIAAVDAATLGAAPAGLTLQSGAYQVTADEGTDAQVAISYPAGINTAVADLYAWNGSSWQFVPSEVDISTGQMRSLASEPLYQAYVIGQMAAPAAPIVGAVLPGEAPAELISAANQLSATGLSLVGNGALEGDIPAALDDNTWLHVTNVRGVMDRASLAAFLDDDEARANQIDLLTNTAVSGGFSGVHVNYQGVAASQTAAFTSFISQLNDSLDAAGLQLAVTLGTPTPTTDGFEATQDWAAIGQLADVVYAQLPVDPTAFVAGGQAEQLLTWAVRLVDRQKLVALVNGGAVDRLGDNFVTLSNQAALENLGTLEFAAGGEEVASDTAVELFLSGDATPLEWDGSSLTYKFSYTENEQTHDVWLANPAALSQRLATALPYNMRGVAVSGLNDVADGPGYAAALGSVTGATAAPEATGAAIVWTVVDGEGSVLASESGSELTFAWDGSSDGEYTISVDFALGDAVAPLDSVAILVGDPAEEVVEEEPDVELSEEEVEEVVEDDEPTTPNTFDPGSADAVVNTNANVRTGPGLSFGLIAGGANAGTTVNLIGRNADSSWLQIVLPTGEEGWMFSTLLTVNASFDVAGLEVVEVSPPTVGDGGGGSGTTPPAPPPPPVTNATFELGGQTAGLPIGAMQASGMTWIKRQHKWSPGNGADVVQGMITEGHNAGFKVLLSIPGQLNPTTTIDYAAYVEFLRGVASLPDPPDAIEVWNEMNITREWPAGEINPTTYVNQMLRPAYNAIKGANPNILVIAGAPAPTGFFGGACGGSGCDDAPYVAGMMAAGAASVSDCLGVHYNEGILPPAATSGDPRGSGGHYTRYFQGMINAYVGAGAGQLCFTELGYLSGEEWGFVPSGFLWRAPYNLTVAEHAQYLAEAVSLAASSGRVRLLIIFNVDFTTWGDDPQAGYAMIRPNGGCPACDTVGAVMRGR